MNNNSRNLSQLTSADSSSQNKQQIKKLKNYILTDLLGKGGFGEVRIGIHELTQKKVAIKILSLQQFKQEQDMRLIVNEIQILQSLRHKMIVKLYEIIRTYNNLYIVMEFVDGVSLAKYLEDNGALDEKRACCIFRQLIYATHYLSKRNICHRDLKLQNLMINDDIELTVIDFGISKGMPGDQLLQTKCGSPHYIAPEMLTQRKYNGTLVDIWACGVILYALLTAALPFQSPDISGLYTLIKAGKYKKIKNISSECQNLIKKMLNTNPDKRITLEEIMEHPWFQNPTFGQTSYPEPESVEIDFKIVKLIKQKYNIPEEITISAVKDNKHNQNSIIYHLELEYEKQQQKIKKQEYKWNLNEQKVLAASIGYKIGAQGNVEKLK